MTIPAHKPLGRPSLSAKAKGETRSQLLDAAAVSFAKDGYAGTSVSQIARAVGITSGAVYKHFSSKADLLITLIKERRLHVGIDQALKGSDVLEPIEFAKIASSYVDTDMNVVRHLILEIYRTALQDEEAGAQLIENQANLHSAVARGLDRSREAGGDIGKGVDTALAADLLIAAAVGLSALEIINKDLIGSPKLKKLIEDSILKLLAE